MVEGKQKARLFFDTETTGLPRNWKAPITDSDNWPRMVQIAWIFSSGDEHSKGVVIIKPDGFEIPCGAVKIHGITTEKAIEKGVKLETVLIGLNGLIKKSDIIIGHNVRYDKKVVEAEFHRMRIESDLIEKERICTMFSTTKYCRLPGPRGNKWPKLQELHKKLFGKEFEGGHMMQWQILKQRNVVLLS